MKSEKECPKITHPQETQQKRFTQTVAQTLSASWWISRKKERQFARTAPKVFALSGFVGLDVLGGLGLLSLERLQQFPRVTSYMHRVTTVEKPPQIPRTPAEPRRTLGETPTAASKKPSERQISSESLGEGCAPRMVTLWNFRNDMEDPLASRRQRVPRHLRRGNLKCDTPFKSWKGWCYGALVARFSCDTPPNPGKPIATECRATGLL